jgi:hypothetical protein
MTLLNLSRPLPERRAEMVTHVTGGKALRIAPMACRCSSISERALI